MERLRSHFNEIKLQDIGSSEIGEDKAVQENPVAEDVLDNGTDVAPDKVHQDECDENVNTLSPEKPVEETEQPTSNASSPKGPSLFL